MRNEIAYWNNRNPVMIDAPTGLGKTTFVYNELFEDAKRKGKNILLVGNRLALSLQQKLVINELQDGDLDVRLTELGLLRQEDFGMVAVITYHRLPAFLHDPKNQKWIQNLLYVVADECHFFVADSMFNPLCGYYLKLITSRFGHAIRVYLTATSWDILYPLAEAEKNNYPSYLPVYSWTPEREFIRYYFPSNNEKYKLEFFGHVEEMISMIKDDPESKWLIFVDDKEKGKKLLARLDSDVDYIDADCKHTQVWREIVRNNQFNKKVLISTAVLDCGINILDDSVQNIVIMCDDRTSFMQMLGRKRCRPGEEVNLWVQVPSAKKIEARLKECEKSLKWLERYDNPKTALESNQRLAYELMRKADPSLLKLFTLSNGRLYRNDLAYFHLLKRRKYLTMLLAGANFCSYVYEWLGIEPLADQSLSELQLFYKENGDKELDEIQQNTLRKIIVKAYIDAGFTEPQQKRVDTHGQEALNNRLCTLGLPYYIERNNSKWRLKKVEVVGE